MSSLRREKIKCFWSYFRKNHNYTVWIFGFTFLLYLFLGLCISYPVTFTKYTFFGSDNQRVYGDLTNIIFNHYRIKVHPLFLLLTQTLTLFLNGLVNYSSMTVVLEEAFCGAMSVSIFYSILKIRKVEKSIRLLFTIIYEFSFSMVVFSTIPETFIFASLGLISYWYFVTITLESDNLFSGKEFLLIIFWGVVCFGITLTNYMSYIVGLIILLASRYDRKDAVKKFLQINIINSIVILGLCIFQKYIWEDCPLFWTSIVGWVQGEGYEEVLYMDWQVNVSKTLTWLNNIFLYPILSPDLYVIEQNDSLACILFNRYSNFFIEILLMLFYLAAFGCIIAKMVNMIRISEKAERRYILGVSAAFCGNVVLHYIYGYMEAFMYTPHFLFLFLLLAAISFQNIKNRNMLNWMKAGLLILCIVEVINNLLFFGKMTNLALAETIFYPIHSIKGVLLFGVEGIALYICWMYISWKKGIVQPILKSAEERIYDVYKIVVIYMMLVIIVGLLIAFNYNMYVVES